MVDERVFVMVEVRFELTTNEGNSLFYKKRFRHGGRKGFRHG